MECDYHYFLYCRPFITPLQTCHGLWTERQGIIVQLRDRQGNLGEGEVAPLPWFGSETIEQAAQFCAGLDPKLNEQILKAIPPHLPCCQFAFESAFVNLQKSLASSDPLNPAPRINPSGHDPNHPLDCLTYSYLLPTGLAALQSMQTGIAQQYRTFKQKIGVQSFERERSLVKDLIALLPTQGNLRLDANGGLNQETAERWLTFADQVDRIELIEQPLPPGDFPALLSLSQQFKTAIALDESIASFAQLQRCYEQGWPGVYVLKAAILGSPSRLGQWLQTHPIDALFSSVFETAIGRQKVLELAIAWGNPNRAVGFGVNHWFEESGEAKRWII